MAHWGPKIITNGMTGCWDFMSSKSYINSTTAKNLINDSNSTISNGLQTSLGLSCNGTSTIVNSGVHPINANLFSLTDLTISAWFMVTGSTQTKNDYAASGKFIVGDSYESDYGWFGIYRTNFQSNDKIWTVIYSTSEQRHSISYTTNQWMNVVLTLTSSTMRTYLNGDLIDTTPGVSINADFANIYTTETLCFGGSRTIIVPAWLGGTISTVNTYNRGLSQSEVIQNYNALKNRFNLS